MIYLELFLTFFKIGLFTFGGGYAMLPLIQKEVLANNWLTQEELVDFVAVSESTPGPFAVNISTYIGMQTGSVLGAVCATLGVILPSFIVILIIASFYSKFRKSKIFQAYMIGLKPGVVGLIGAAILSIALLVFFPAGIAYNVFLSPQFYFSLVVFAVMVFLAFKKVHPIIIICLSALAGIAFGLLN